MVELQQLDGAGPAGDSGLGRLVQGVGAGRMVEPRPGAVFELFMRQRRPARRHRPRQGPVPLVNALAHRLRDNAPRRPRANIAAHYDLGNDFYAPGSTRR